MTRKYLKIVSTPSGEAPLIIREAWIGVSIPYPEGTLIMGPRNALLGGVITGTFRGIKEVYDISAKDAINALALLNPDAAQWWKDMGLVHGEFIFEAKGCGGR